MILEEAERLYGYGFGVHWIRKNSKAPVKDEWSGPVRDTIETVKADYKKGFGLGVRLGQPSKLKDGHFLANIDVDIKSEGHQRKALKRLEHYFPGLFEKAPVVKTGMGYRLFVKTETPMKSVKIYTSPDLCKVYLPGSPVNRRQQEYVKSGMISAKELENGWRIRAAYELEFMSAGKQVVLPPSIHPDTGRAYAWQRPVKGVGSIPVLEPEKGIWKAERDDNSADKGRSKDGGSGAEKFRPVKYELTGLSDATVGMVVDGIDVDDRSAALYSAAMAMLRAGFTDDEILSCLTDKENFLGEVAFEHRNTSSRSNAADWLRVHTLRKAKDEISAGNAFKVSASETPLLKSTEAVNAQSEKMVTPPQDRFEYDRYGNLKSNFANALIILRKEIGKLIGRDEFAMNDKYLGAPPWGWEKGRVAADNDDCIQIKKWLNDRWGIAPPTTTIFEVVTSLAMANSFHPIKRELESLPEWDGKARINTWLTKFFEAKDPVGYVGDVFRKWLLASITRIYQPGTKFDWMPVLEGITGGGKSEFAKIIAGRQYHIDNIPSLNKEADAAIQLEGVRIVEFGELSTLKKSTDQIVKGFITRENDKVRRPYDRKPVIIARQCVFIGTTNEETYLFDETGNRRYNPLRVGVLNRKQLLKDRDQLWAEALWIYENLGGESLYLKGESLKYSKEIQLDKMVASDAAMFLEKIYIHFTSEAGKSFNYSRFRILELFDIGGPLEEWKPDGKNIQSAATALKQLGATKRKIEGFNYRVLDAEIVRKFEKTGQGS